MPDARCLIGQCPWGPALGPDLDFWIRFLHLFSRLSTYIVDDTVREGLATRRFTFLSRTQFMGHRYIAIAARRPHSQCVCVCRCLLVLSRLASPRIICLHMCVFSYQLQWSRISAIRLSNYLYSDTGLSTMVCKFRSFLYLKVYCGIITIIKGLVKHTYKM